MIHREPFPLKNLCLWSLLVCGGLFTAYVIFLALVSIWTGLSCLQEDGFWMPILTGIIGAIVMLWAFLRFTRFIRDRTKEKDVIYT